jgi:hypothetical protein
MQESADPKKWDAQRARFEVPPQGYTGSLKGTVWDPDAVLETYNQ